MSVRRRGPLEIINRVVGADQSVGQSARSSNYVCVLVSDLSAFLASHDCSYLLAS